MPAKTLKDKDVVEIYEQGKHRRYGVLFAVNGGAFAIGKLLVGDTAAVLGGLRLWMLAIAMVLFSGIMAWDIWKFGERMRDFDEDLFGDAGKIVLVLLAVLLVAAWLIVGFGPPVPPSAA